MNTLPFSQAIKANLPSVPYSLVSGCLSEEISNVEVHNLQSFMAFVEEYNTETLLCVLVSHNLTLPSLELARKIILD